MEGEQLLRLQPVAGYPMQSSTHPAPNAAPICLTARLEKKKGQAEPASGALSQAGSGGRSTVGALGASVDVSEVQKPHDLRHSVRM